jgi:hypothetical protein
VQPEGPRERRWPWKGKQENLEAWCAVWAKTLEAATGVPVSGEAR